MATVFNIYYHPKAHKKSSFLVSRTALLNCLPKNLGLTLEDLEIKDHLNLKKAPQFKVSLSHTSYCGAAIVSDSLNILSVGIDI